MTAREKVFAVLSDKPVSLYDVMRLSKVGGWEAAQELKAMVKEGLADVVRDNATCYRRRAMKDWFYPTAFSCWGPEEADAIERVVLSGKFTMGEQVAAFEREFADFHGMKHGIMVNSGSSANLLAVAALCAKEDEPVLAGDTAIVPALAWSTTYAPLVQHGLKISLADCDGSWNASMLQDSIADNAHLIVGCSILGNPAYLGEWKRQAHRTGAYFIEDNCESFGAQTREGTLCGTSGIMNTFSFFYSHQISAIEGGMILTDDDECASLCRMLRSHGWTRGLWPIDKFEDEYDFRVFGYNVRPLEMHAAIAREQLRKTEKFRFNRMVNARQFRSETKDLPIEHPRWSGMINPFGLHFLCESEERRRDLVVAFRGVGIDCRLPTGGSFRMHRYGIEGAGQYTPNADDIHRRGIFIGNAPFDISDKIDRAVKVMKGCL
jgi:CDP-4-dehydro-6-deoxyglucose reductase, E1